MIAHGSFITIQDHILRTNRTSYTESCRNTLRVSTRSTGRNWDNKEQRNEKSYDTKVLLQSTEHEESVSNQTELTVGGEPFTWLDFLKKHKLYFTQSLLSLISFLTNSRMCLVQPKLPEIKTEQHDTETLIDRSPSCWLGWQYSSWSAQMCTDCY